MKHESFGIPPPIQHSDKSQGYANAFGVFQEYYMTHQLRDRSPDDISWIGSLSAFLQFAIGAVAGPLFDRYGPWV